MNSLFTDSHPFWTRGTINELEPRELSGRSPFCPPGVPWSVAQRSGDPVPSGSSSVTRYLLPAFSCEIKTQSGVFSSGEPCTPASCHSPQPTAAAETGWWVGSRVWLWPPWDRVVKSLTWSRREV